MWRQDELGVINETMTGAERKAALCSLLEQEAQLIASIGQHKNAAVRENKDKNTKRFLDAVSGSRSYYHSLHTFCMNLSRAKNFLLDRNICQAQLPLHYIKFNIP